MCQVESTGDFALLVDLLELGVKGGWRVLVFGVNSLEESKCGSFLCGLHLLNFY